MKRMYELLEKIAPMKKEAKEHALNYIRERVNAANGKRISFTDEYGDAFGGETVYVTFDGGNHPEYAANPFSVVRSVYIDGERLYVDCEDCDDYESDRLEWGDIIDIADYLYRCVPENPDEGTISREEVIEFMKENGVYAFGRFTEEIAGLIADEVVAEYNEAGDCDLSKAVSYVIGDKFGMFDEKKVWVVNVMWNTDGDYTSTSYVFNSEEGALKGAKEVWDEVFASGHFEGAEDGVDGCVLSINEDGTFYEVWDECDDYSCTIGVSEKIVGK